MLWFTFPEYKIQKKLGYIFFYSLGQKWILKINAVALYDKTWKATENTFDLKIF